MKTVYMAADGKIFENEQICKDYERGLLVIDKYNKITKIKNVVYGFYESIPYYKNIPQLIFDNYDKIKEIMENDTFEKSEEVDWTQVRPGTMILVKSINSDWIQREFVKYEPGVLRPFYCRVGNTSNGNLFAWEEAKLK